ATGRATALPATAQEAAAVVNLARDEGWVVAPHWAGPAVAAASRASAPRSALYVSPERLDRVDEVVPADLMAVVGAGVSVGALETRVAADGLCWPPAAACDPGDMVGDVIARLPGGWTMEGNLTRRYLLALDAVLADGSLLHAGARTVKSVTGYDLKQLMVGSRGTLGVITSLTLRLEAVANRESVLERYRRDFAGMGGGAVPGRAGIGGADAAIGGALLILERLKRELDPTGVFPDVGTLMRTDATV
ncbi:MAG: FAD-binding oxidoreductase, partial [Candidatus Eisenbacteria bacterium]